MIKHDNIFLIGPMGAGKTSIGRQLAQNLRLDFYDSDEIIEQRTGADIPWIFDIEGEDGFRKREEEVIAELTKLRNIVLATGGGVIASPKNRQVLTDNGTIIYFKASIDGQIERTGRSKKRPLSSEKTLRIKKLQNLWNEYAPLYESLADFVYHTENSSVSLIVRDIIEKLQQKMTIKQ
jgi:shikimate kinase